MNLVSFWWVERYFAYRKVGVTERGVAHGTSPISEQKKAELKADGNASSARRMAISPAAVHRRRLSPLYPPPPAKIRGALMIRRRTLPPLLLNKPEN